MTDPLTPTGLRDMCIGDGGWHLCHATMLFVPVQPGSSKAELLDCILLCKSAQNTDKGAQPGTRGKLGTTRPHRSQKRSKFKKTSEQHVPHYLKIPARCAKLRSNEDGT